MDTKVSICGYLYAPSPTSTRTRRGYWRGSRALCAALDRWCRSPAPADDIDMGTLDQFDFFDDDFRPHHKDDSDDDDSEHDDDFEDESDAPGCVQ